jgi:2,3-bisphosphoglycerate-independent phosphoglycerate mutase
MASYAGGHIATPDSRAIVARLADALNDETFTLSPGKAYRHILVVKGHPELLDVRYTPPHDISDRPVAEFLPQGPGADLLLGLMEAARPLLLADPTNARLADENRCMITDIWPFWPGTAPAGLRSFAELRGGLRAAMTSGVDLLRGLSVLFGFRFLELDGVKVTDGLDNDFAGQAEGALAALEADEADVVVIHVEAPDEMGHAGDIEAKLDAIEAIDRDIVSRLLGYGSQHGGAGGGGEGAAGEGGGADADEGVGAGEGVRILAMPDHYTPIATKTHEGIPVPFLLWGSGIEPNGAENYSEEAAAATGLTLDPDGWRVMDLLLG